MSTKSVAGTTDTRDLVTERASRSAAYAELAARMDELPAPEQIGFTDSYPDQLRVELSTPDDFDAWAASFEATVWKRDKLIEHADGCRSRQSHATVNWLGYYLTIGCCILVTDEAVADGGESR